MSSFLTWVPRRLLRDIHHRVGGHLAETDAIAARLANQTLARGIAEKYDRINIGCGFDKRPGYLNVDVDPSCSPDILIVNDDDSMIPRQHFVEVFAFDVIEHIPRNKTLSTLLTWADYLVTGGRLIVDTSSILGAAAKLERSTLFADQYAWTACLFGNQVHAADFHLTGFTEVTLKVYLLAAGLRIESMRVRDDWLLNARATKVENWAALADADVSNADFMKEAYRSAYFRDIGEGDLGYWMQRLDAGLARKDLLKMVYSAPERLFRIAERNGL